MESTGFFDCCRSLVLPQVSANMIKADSCGRPSSQQAARAPSPKCRSIARNSREPSGVLAALCPGVWCVGQLVTGAWSDRVGRKPLLVAGMCSKAQRSLSWRPPRVAARRAAGAIFSYKHRGPAIASNCGLAADAGLWRIDTGHREAAWAAAADQKVCVHHLVGHTKSPLDLLK